MRPALSVLLSALLGGSIGFAQSSPVGRLVDLGHALSPTSPTWTGEPAYERTGTGDVATDGYTGGRFTADEHFGTHLDAPAHFGGAWTVDRIPVDRLVRPGVCLNVEAKVAADEDYRVSLADVLAFERAHGPIPEGAMVLVATGWDRRWPDRARYMNERDDVKHFPGISADAAQYLAADRKVAGIGIDTASIDYGPSATFEAHRTTQPHNVYHVENAANLTGLPPGGFAVIVAPVNIEGGSGGPTRMFALLSKE